jgi:hypothetical protein
MFQKLVELAKEVNNAGLSHDCIYDIVAYCMKNNHLPKEELFKQLNIIIDNYKLGKAENM